LEDGHSERIYRTGDLVRGLPDGSFEFIGRIDRQMKIRGYRVEPAEIESRLNAHPAIASSVVMARRDLSGQATLVAFFIVGEGQPAPSPAGLSAYLAVTLPDYMIPSAFVQKSEWPLSAHGKVDRDALLESLRTEHREEETAASNDSERALRELCRKVIGTSSIGLDESLIAYGLHSLSAANLAWMIEEKFQVRVRLSEILQKPSFGGLLALVEGKKHTDANGTDPRLEVRTARPRAIPLSFPQEQIWFLEKLHPHLNSYRFQSLLHFRGALDVGVLEATLNRMVSRHEILRTVFLSEDEIPRQEIRPHVPFRLIPEDLRGMAEGVRPRELDRLIREELRRPFDLKAGPLIRWRLFQWDDNAFELLHTEHHFLHDGWGYGVFLAELYATYKALSEKKDVALSSAPIQFADFALWQRDAMASGAWDHQLAFWQKELAGCPAPPTLPSDHRIGVPRTFAGSQIRRPFPQAIWDELGSVCSREGVTRFAWIHAAFQLFVRESLFQYMHRGL
jgi:acyl carrier protein